jgi:hypothetical protein
MNEAHGHYAYEIHGAAEEHHRHYDTESELRELRSLVAGLREDLSRAEDRIRGLESQTPQARQLQLEADLAAADLAEPGYDRWPPEGADRHGPGCQCPECYVPSDADQPPIEAGLRGYGEDGCPDNCPGSWHGCDYHDEGEPDEYGPRPGADAGRELEP